MITDVTDGRHWARKVSELALALTNRQQTLVAVGVAALLSIIRIPMILEMHRPLIVWDEITYLAIARYFAGAGQPLDFSIDPNVEHVGYGLLSSVAFLPHGPFEITYHLVLLLNLALAAVTTYLVYTVARRIAGAPFWLAVLSTTAIASYPAFFVMPTLVFSENLVFPLALLSTLSLFEAVNSERSVPWHLVFVLSVVAMWLTHSATMPFVLAGCLTIAALALGRRLPPYIALLDIALIGLGWLVANIVDQHFWSIMWGQNSDLVFAREMMAAFSLEGSLRFILSLSRTQFALAIPSLGMYVVGLVVVAREMLGGKRTGWSARAVACSYVILGTIGCALLSAMLFSAFPPSGNLDTMFAARYVEPSLLLILSIGLPLFMTALDVPTRLAAVLVVAVTAALSAVATRSWDALWYQGAGESVSELALAGLAHLVRGGTVITLAAVSLAVGALVLVLRRRQPHLALVALFIAWTVMSLSEFTGQISSQQKRFDILLGAKLSLIAPYVSRIPDQRAVAYEVENVLTYNLLAFALPNERVIASGWPSGSAPPQGAAVATEAHAPTGFGRVACERFVPIECLYVRSRSTSQYLRSLAERDAFSRPIDVGDGAEIGVSYIVNVTWRGLYPIETTPDGIPFRWTDGNATVVLPRVKSPVSHAQLWLSVPNRGHITIRTRQPGAKSYVTVVDGPDAPGGNAFAIPLRPYVPGTTVSILTTNTQPGGTDSRRLSVEIRNFRLLP